MSRNNNGDVFLVYDGECPLCRAGANNFCINEEIEGKLERINKRSANNHIILVKRNNLNLDKGMILKYKGYLYQGAEALHQMTKLSKGNGWAVRLSKILFSYKTMAYACYPFLRGTRNILIKIKGVGPLHGS